MIAASWLLFTGPRSWPPIPRPSSDWRGAGEKEKASTENVEALPFQRKSSNVHLLRTATHPSIGGRAGLGIAQGPPKVRTMRQVFGEVA